MRIAQVAPLVEPVPPERYGGIESVVSHLTDQLVELGLDVTLYAVDGSVTRALLDSSEEYVGVSVERREGDISATVHK